MACKHFDGAVLCCSGGTEYRIVADGREYRFDFGAYVGPSLIGKRGGYLASIPPHKFLVAVSWWCRQGKRVGEDGLCIWEIPKSKWYRIAGRHYVTESHYQKLRAEGKFVTQEIEPEWLEDRL
jgi:hypothetical protein